MEIVQIPALADNYVYLLHEPASGTTAAVDPPEAEGVLRALAERGWVLTHILNTHFHGDHVGGNLTLKSVTGCRIVGHATAREPIPGLDQPVDEGDCVRLGDSEARVLAVPGHTAGHVAYWLPATSRLFCGDTLFGMGCGRLLGGSAGQLWASLQRLRQLPGDTLVYYAHEYTLNNGRFALTVEPGNPRLVERQQRTRALREAGRPTVPSRLAEECDTNPFLRPESPAIRASLGLEGASDLAVFSELRRRKDHF